MLYIKMNKENSLFSALDLPWRYKTGMWGGGVGETEAKLFQVKTPVYISPSSNVPTNDDLNRLMSIKHNAQLLSKLQNDLRKTAL